MQSSFSLGCLLVRFPAANQITQRFPTLACRTFLPTFNFHGISKIKVLAEVTASVLLSSWGEWLQEPLLLDSCHDATYWVVAPWAAAQPNGSQLPRRKSLAHTHPTLSLPIHSFPCLGNKLTKIPSRLKTQLTSPGEITQQKCWGVFYSLGAEFRKAQTSSVQHGSQAGEKRVTGQGEPSSSLATIWH